MNTPLRYNYGVRMLCAKAQQALEQEVDLPGVYFFFLRAYREAIANGLPPDQWNELKEEMRAALDPAELNPTLQKHLKYDLFEHFFAGDNGISYVGSGGISSQWLDRIRKAWNGPDPDFELGSFLRDLMQRKKPTPEQYRHIHNCLTILGGEPGTSRSRHVATNRIITILFPNLYSTLNSERDVDTVITIIKSWSPQFNTDGIYDWETKNHRVIRFLKQNAPLRNSKLWPLIPGVILRHRFRPGD